MNINEELIKIRIKKFDGGTVEMINSFNHIQNFNGIKR